MTKMSRLLVASCIIALSAPAIAGAVALPPAAAQATPASRTRTSGDLPEKATAAEVQSYAARESATAKNLAKFEGGSPFYIAVPLIAVVLAVVLILVLL